MGVIWGSDGPGEYHTRARHAIPRFGGLITFLHSVFSYWRRGF